MFGFKLRGATSRLLAVPLNLLNREDNIFADCFAVILGEVRRRTRTVALNLARRNGPFQENGRKVPIHRYLTRIRKFLFGQVLFVVTPQKNYLSHGNRLMYYCGPPVCRLRRASTLHSNPLGTGHVATRCRAHFHLFP